MYEQKPKILFLLCHGWEYYRNYITSPALDMIKDRCYFIVHEKLFNKDFAGIGRDRIFSYTYPPRKAILHRHIFNINTWRYRKKSSSFLPRFQGFKPRLQRIYKILSTPLLYQFSRSFFLFKAHDKTLAELIKKIDPSIVLIPSSAHEGVSFETIRICKKLGIPTFMLIDNWDNISSKTIFTYLPDFLGVWSRQAVEHAVKIRDMPKEKIFILGTPRFVDYFKLRNKKLPSLYPFKYILFAGCSFGFDELTCLKKLDEIIEKRDLDVRVVYRPHPWRKHRKGADTFFEYDFKNTTIDEQAKLYYKRDEDDEFNDFYRPELGYYPKLLANMEFMICPLSTMMIEGLIFNKKVFALAYDDNAHTVSPKVVYDRYEHYRGIEKLKNIRMIFEFNDLEKIFSGSDELKGPTDPIDLDYFISDNTGNYPQLLKAAVDKILSS